jgi:hypothetical protein
MNTSPKYEAKISEMMAHEIRKQFRDTTLPPNHIQSRHVRRVVSRILAASNLGVVRGEDTPFSYIESPDGGVGGGRSARIPEQEREWDVMVVNNPNMVNAQVVPGNIIFPIDVLAAAHATPQASLLSTLESYPYVKTNMD